MIKAFFFTLSSMLLLKCATNSPNVNTYVFSDSFDYINNRFDVTFHVDSLYHEDNTFNGFKHEAAAAYKFSSLNDTIYIAIYIQNKTNHISIDSLKPNKSTQRKFFNDYGCEISDDTIIKSFFDGILISCDGGINVMTFAGFNNELLGEQEVSVYILSESKEKNSGKRFSAFSTLIHSITVRSERL